MTARVDPDSPSHAEPAGSQRLARLTERAGALRARGSKGGHDERWLLLVGGIAMPLGLLLILLGWYGSAQTALPFEQIPFLISGGLLGLALVVGGGLLYFAYWLTLQVREARVDRERVAAHQERLEQALADLAARLGPVATTSATDERVVTTPGGTLLHRPTCRATAGLAVIEMAFDDAGLELCGLCRPSSPPLRPAPATRRPAAAPRRRASR